VWSQQGAKLVGTGAVGAALQGASVAVSADGNTAVVGGYNDNGFAGAAWVFVNAAPKIASIGDVPNDQGGKVHVLWNASAIDLAPSYGISSYTLWRRITTAAAAQAAEHGVPLVRVGDASRASALYDQGRRAIRVTAEGTQALYWEFVESVPARGVSGYGYMAPTTSDSLPGSIPWNVFFVDAKDATTTAFYVSAPDSGYSVDNLPPGPPAPVAAAYSTGATYLHWGVSLEADFSIYRVYRGASAEFVPGTGNLVATKPDTGYADVGPAGSYYKISAVDDHGNESSFALVTPAQTTGVSADTPLAFALEKVRPNPALGRDLTVHFVLPVRAAARLELLDVAGRSVVARDVGALGPGAHAVNLAEQTPVRPGLYFVRLKQEAKARVARVVVLQ
jgi:hypothetical protein